MTHRQRVSVLALGPLFLVAACQPERGAAPAARTRPLVCTTLRPIQFLVNHLTAGSVDCEVVLPENVDPHHQTPTRDAMVRLTEADIVLFHGAGLEGFLDKIALTRKQRWVLSTELDAYLIKIPNAITHTHGGKAHTHDGTDPYLWLDPKLLSRQADTIARAMATLLPKGKTDIQARLQAVQAQLAAALKADREAFAGLKRIATTDRVYAYWARSRGIEVVDLDLPRDAVTAERRAELEKLVADESVRIAVTPREPSAAQSELLRSLGLKPVVVRVGLTKLGLDPLREMAGNRERLRAALR